jgi:hypothetical protein
MEIMKSGGLEKRLKKMSLPFRLQSVVDGEQLLDKGTKNRN